MAIPPPLVGLHALDKESQLRAVWIIMLPSFISFNLTRQMENFYHKLFQNQLNTAAPTNSSGLFSKCFQLHVWFTQIVRQRAAGEEPSEVWMCVGWDLVAGTSRPHPASPQKWREFPSKKAQANSDSWSILYCSNLLLFFSSKQFLNPSKYYKKRGCQMIFLRITQSVIWDNDQEASTA